MKINKFNLINNYLNQNVSCQKPTALTLKPQLTKDTVSFGYLDERVDPNLQLYRCISESEFKNLLKGDTFHSKYATSDPRGWRAKNWDNGFVYVGTKEPVYFITFKTGRLDIDSRRDSTKDTRYGIEEYTIDDVQNVREGNNAHGKIVYAKNLDEAREKDKKEKEERISELKQALANKKDQKEREKIWDELASFAHEFPFLVEETEQFVNSENESDLNSYIFLIQKADDEKYMPIYKKCLNTLLKNNMEIKPKVLSYFAKYAKNEDLETLFQIADSKKTKKYKYAKFFAKFMQDEETSKRIIERFKNKDNESLLLLADCLKNDNEDGKHLGLFREILSNCTKPKDDIAVDDDDYDDTPEFIYKLILETCAKEIGKFGNESDISLLKGFVNKQKPESYPSNDILCAIDEIKRHKFAF